MPRIFSFLIMVLGGIVSLAFNALAGMAIAYIVLGLVM